MIKSIVNQRFIDCIDFLIETKKVPSKSFLAEKFNISNSKFSEILNKRMNVGIDLLMVLASDFNISSDWLLLGRGEMLKTAPALTPVQEPHSSNNDKYITSLEKINALQEEKITAQSKQIEELIKKIERLEQENKAFQGGSQDRAVR